MPLLLDTNVAIHLRDGDEEIIARLATVADTMALSMATMIELQAGLAVVGELAERRRVGLGRLLKHCEVFDLDASVVAAYGDILATAGFSRTRVFDRLIAATALVHDLTLVTINGPDFLDIPGLKLEVWPSPAQ